MKISIDIACKLRRMPCSQEIENDCEGLVMAYICQNCGVNRENAESVCNPISDMYKNKSCSIETAGVCADYLQEMTYACDCGNTSADPQHLCRPHKV